MVINNCQINDDAAYSVSAGEEKCTTELFVKGASSLRFHAQSVTELIMLTFLNTACQWFDDVLFWSYVELPVNIVKKLEPVKTTVNERIELECEVSEEGAKVKWYVQLRFFCVC